MELRLMFGVNMIPGVIWVLGMFLCMIKELSHSFIGGGSPKTRVSKENQGSLKLFMLEILRTATRAVP
jgi:hypothetical protein